MKRFSWAYLLPAEKGVCFAFNSIILKKQHMMERTAVSKRGKPLSHEQKTVAVVLRTDFSRSCAIKHMLVRHRHKGRAIREKMVRIFRFVVLGCMDHAVKC